MIERFKERWPLVRPLLIPLAVYFLLLPVVAYFLEIFPESPWRFAVVLAPMVPGALIAIGLVNVIRRLDELSRKVIFESLAIASAATLFLLLSLGLLEMAGLPRPSSLYIGGFMITVWIVAKLAISRRYQ